MSSRVSRRLAGSGRYRLGTPDRRPDILLAGWITRVFFDQHHLLGNGGRVASLILRGAPASDMAALAGVIVGFSDLANELGDFVDAVEANPVIASAAGVIAVDALVYPRDQKIE